MNKQTLIDDYKQTIERLQKECTEKTDFNIKLMERVKELEEKLKIVEQALYYYASSKMPDDIYTSEIICNNAIYTPSWVDRYKVFAPLYKLRYDTSTAKRTLQKIKEVTNEPFNNNTNK